MGAGANSIVITPLLTETVCDENTARLPLQECVISCQRLGSNELKSSRNRSVKSPPEELDELLEDELLEDELLDDDELLEDELDVLDDEHPPIIPPPPFWLEQVSAPMQL